MSEGRQEERQSDGGGGTRSLTAEVIARLVGGTLHGDADVAVKGVAALDRAGPEHLSFYASGRYASSFAASRAGVVLVAPDLADATGGPGCRVVVERPQEAMMRVLPSLYVDDAPPPGIHPTAVLGRGVRLGRNVAVGPWATIGEDAQIGDGAVIDAHCAVGRGAVIGTGTRLHPNVTVYPGARVGARVRLHAGVRIGCDGFGYVQLGGAHTKIPHVGGCVIEDDVEIGANSTIDRGSIDDTVVGAGTKIDNLVHVAHNVRIGRGCLILAQVGIAGSCRIEDGAVLAGQAGVGGHVTVGAGARIAGQAGVFGDVPPGSDYSGYPARPHKESLRAHAALFRLAGIVRKLEKLVEDRER